MVLHPLPVKLMHPLLAKLMHPLLVTLALRPLLMRLCEHQLPERPPWLVSMALDPICAMSMRTGDVNEHAHRRRHNHHQCATLARLIASNAVST